MRIFRRRPGTHPTHRDLRAELRGSVSTVTIVPDVDPRPAARARLLRVVSEAVLLQDKAAELLADIRDREPLAELAPRGGPLATRFFELRQELPAPADAEMARRCEIVSTV